MSSLGLYVYTQDIRVPFRICRRGGGQKHKPPIHRRLPVSVLGGLDDDISCVLTVQHGRTKPVRGP